MFKRGSISFLLLCAPILWQASSIVLAAERAQGRAGSETDDPILITSDRMTVKNSEDQIHFEGHVSIRKKETHIQAETATLFLESTGAPSKSGGVTSRPSRGRIELQGDVRIQQGEVQASAQRGVYDQKKQEIVLTGAPMAWEPHYRVKGETITFNLAEKRTRVEKSEVTIQTGSIENEPSR